MQHTAAAFVKKSMSKQGRYMKYMRIVPPEWGTYMFQKHGKKQNNGRSM